jgi:hypothetical protein
MPSNAVMLPLLAKISDPGGVLFGKLITELLELLIPDLDVPAFLDGAPALLKVQRVGFRQVTFRIALHVNGAE